jgi:HK97 family phage prohead protease
MVGYALRWDHPAFVSKHGQPFEERFVRGAFTRSIAAGNVLMCSDHDRAAIVSRQDNGTLTLFEDHVGLRVDAWAMPTVAGDDAIHDARCRSRAGLSVCFESADEEWRDTDGGRLRVVKDCRLVEVSVVRNPAYRSSELFAGKLRIERFLASIDPSVDRAARLAAAEARLTAWHNL